MVVEFKHVSYSYPMGGEALCDVSFRISPGEKVALVGCNGAGKSTLMLHTNGLLLPSSGVVMVDGVEVDKSTAHMVRQRVGILFQNSDEQLFMPTVREEVAFGPCNMHLSEEMVTESVARALAMVDASHLIDKAPYMLSEGQKKSVAIASVLSMNPSILVMDEPTASLDPRSRRNLIALVRSMPHTVLIATHDMEMVRLLCPRTIVMGAGRIIADAPTDSVFADAALLENAGL
jgi:cobalt/nickel transport system ATP-binding protein